MSENQSRRSERLNRSMSVAEKQAVYSTSRSRVSRHCLGRRSGARFSDARAHPAPASMAAGLPHALQCGLEPPDGDRPANPLCRGDRFASLALRDEKCCGGPPMPPPAFVGDFGASQPASRVEPGFAGTHKLHTSLHTSEGWLVKHLIFNMVNDRLSVS